MTNLLGLIQTVENDLVRKSTKERTTEGIAYRDGGIAVCENLKMHIKNFMKVGRATSVNPRSGKPIE